MNIKLILIAAFSVLYGLFEIFMSRRKHGRREISAAGDKGSVWFLITAWWEGGIERLLEGKTNMLKKLRKKKALLISICGTTFGKLAAFATLKLL